MTMTTTTSPDFKLSALGLDEWHALRVYQDLYQLLLTQLHDGGVEEREAQEARDEEAPDSSAQASAPEASTVLGLTEERLRERALSLLSGPERQLLELTFDELVQQLLDAQWVRRLSHGELALSRAFERRVHKVLEGLNPFDEPKVKAKPKVERRKRDDEGLEYVDVFTHISAENDTIITARHMEQIITALDGVTLLRKSLYELVSFSKHPDYEALLSLMVGAQLIRYEDSFVRLDLQGAHIAREPRAQRFSLLAVIAERLRRDQARAQR
jgi:hypothetical protein